MRLLVTGGCGFIGSTVIRYGIRQLGATILNIDKLTYAGTPEALEDVEQSGRYHFMCADICDTEALDTAFSEFAPDAVMHLAAESHVDRSIDGPAAFIETNLVGTFKLLEAARRYWLRNASALNGRFRFQHISTDEVFGSLDDAAPSFTESTAYQPRSPYAASKAGSDHLVRAWGETFGMPVLITNCSNNYGPWQFPEKLIPLTIIKARKQELLQVYGEGRNIRDWLYVEDHARALWEVLANGRIGQTYNIGGNAEHQNIDVVRAICSLMDARFPDQAPHERLIRFVTDRPGHDMRYAIDASKIRTELGWKPSFDLDTGLAVTIDWYLEQENWWRGILADNYDGRRLGISIEPQSSNGACAGREKQHAAL